MTSLTESTIADLRSTFEGIHFPSDAMWEAIEDVAETIEKMAKGTASKVFYVSSLDPGVGKTQTIIHATKNIPSNVGVLICVARLEEIESLQEAMGLSREETGIYTSDEELNLRGAIDADKARVLFTTQQMVDRRLKDGSKFNDLKQFYFRGKPRSVRIWDESMLPGEELTLSVVDLGGIPKLLRRKDQALKDKLLQDAGKISQLSDGSTYQVPDLEEAHDISSIEMQYLIELIPKEHKRDRKALETLWRLSGKLVAVTRDNGGNTILDYRDHLPDDFAPVLILDASARVRRTYEHWAKSRGNLVKLKEARKSYRNLTVHHWNTGGGKDSWRKKQRGLVDGIAATINSKPEEQWLVVIHKDEGNDEKGGIPDLSKAIGDLVKGDKSRVQYLTWGNHVATNDYVDVPNVILAGTLFYPPSTYATRARASKGIKASEKLSADDFQDIELGEHSHLILQAMCRGSVRKCIKDACSTCDGYIIAYKNTGIDEKLLAEIFPDSKLEIWKPVGSPAKGRAKEALDLLDLCFEGKDDDYALSFKEHREWLGISDLANYNKNIRKHPDFRAGCQERRIFETAFEDARYRTHFMRSPAMMTDTELEARLKAIG